MLAPVCMRYLRNACMHIGIDINMPSYRSSGPKRLDRFTSTFRFVARGIIDLDK